MLENRDFNRGCDRIQTPAFSTRTEHSAMAGFSFVTKLVNASENGDFNRGHKNFQTECSKSLLEQQRKLHKLCNGRIFICYTKLVNASENGDFNRGHKNFQTECSKSLLEQRRKLHKTSWTYMTENGVDSLYLFLYPLSWLSYGC